ncbi:hypothetical protein PWY87_34550 [Kribbella solani]|uniref:hypothetical protein n=1 Tax=Kribbella solani TaxID=236067 RepID=UPI0029B147B4|nr:hypothetical protein [Kribbella solani]MDX3006838.1 hypothetical protein [Kribbella solani]
MAEKIPSWPKVTIRLYDDHNAEVKIAGRSHPVNHHDPRQAAIQLVSERAAQLGRAVKATAVEADGASWPLIINPDGSVEAVEAEGGRGRGGRGGGGSKPIWPIIVAAVVALALIAGTAVYLLVLRKPSGPPKPSVSPTLPSLPAPIVTPDQFVARPVPPGWSKEAGWTVDIMPNTTPAVSPDGTEVAILTVDQKLAVFDANGKVLWQDTLPSRTSNPVYTTIDSKPALVVTTEDTLYYWPGHGALPTAIELPNSSAVQFFGTSPLITLAADAGNSVISGGQLKSVQPKRRDSTVLLAEGDRVLSARYGGPLYWDQPGKDQKPVNLAGPKDNKGLDHIVAASPGLVLALWKTGVADTVIPVVHSSATGAVVASCKAARVQDAERWQWVPDNARKVAAWGACLINYTTKTSVTMPGFQPLSISGTTVYGMNGSEMVTTIPGSAAHRIPDNTARPWGIVGNHAIVVQGSYLYALNKATS